MAITDTTITNALNGRPPKNMRNRIAGIPKALTSVLPPDDFSPVILVTYLSFSCIDYLPAPLPQS